MPVVKIVKEQFVADLFDFLEKFGLKEQFLKDQNIGSLDDWDFPVSDEEIIVKYLDQKPEHYVVFADFDSHGDGDFWIAQIDTTGAIKTVKDYIYCEDCQMFVDFYKYDYDLENAGHKDHKWRHVTEQELAQCIKDCQESGCFKEE